MDRSPARQGSLGSVLESLSARFDELHVEIATLQANEDEVRHEIGRETRRRDDLRAREAAGGLDATAQRAMTREVVEAEAKLAELRERLAQLQARLAWHR